MHIIRESLESSGTDCFHYFWRYELLHNRTAINSNADPWWKHVILSVKRQHWRGGETVWVRKIMIKPNSRHILHRHCMSERKEGTVCPFGLECTLRPCIRTHLLFWSFRSAISKSAIFRLLARDHFGHASFFPRQCIGTKGWDTYWYKNLTCYMHFYL